MMHVTTRLFVVGCLTVLSTFATHIIYDGRAPFNLTDADLDASVGPFLTIVKGSENASHYSHLLGRSVKPTPLWNEGLFFTSPREQAISPGGSNPQFGFRRTDIIAADNGEHDGLITLMEQNTTAFHFSIQNDEQFPLNFNHEYQIVFIEPNDGSHIFGIQLGSPFTNPTGALPAPHAHSFKVLDHALNVLFSTPFSPHVWHNFAVTVDWDARTLVVLYSQGVALLQRVTGPLPVPNPTAAPGADGRGDFHFGVLKLPLVNPADSPADQGDVVHFGIQEGTKEGLFYSGVFVEDAAHGTSMGLGVVS